MNNKEVKNRANGKGSDAVHNMADAFAVSANPVVAIDVEKYQSWLDDSDLSDQEKQEFLQALWNIVVAFVELGFGVHPLQEVCGQQSVLVDQSAKEAFNRVSSSEPNATRKGLTFSPSGEPEVK